MGNKGIDDKQILAFERRSRILEIVNKNKSMSVEEIAAHFPVSEITIRRDLDKLSEEGMLTRVHGGAVALTNFIVAPRASEQADKITEEQMRIGKEAAKRISNGEFIVLESGSTCNALAQNLWDKKNLKLVTVSPIIAMVLADLAEKHDLNFEIILSGGILNVYKNFLLGPHSRQLFETIKVEKAFISVTAIDLEAGITADSINEAEISKIILEKCAKKRYGLITSHKFGKTSFVKVADAQIFDEVITDSKVDPDIVSRFMDSGIKVTIV